MKCPCQDKIIVRGQFLEPGLELSVVDETTSLVDYDERKNRPSFWVSVSLNKKESLITQPADVHCSWPMLWPEGLSVLTRSTRRRATSVSARSHCRLLLLPSSSNIRRRCRYYSPRQSSNCTTWRCRHRFQSSNHRPGRCQEPATCAGFASLASGIRHIT